MRVLAHCDSCGRRMDIHHLDAKPTMTRWLWLVWFFRGQTRMLVYAADHGYDFDRLECRDCYGSGYLDA